MELILIQEALSLKFYTDGMNHGIVQIPCKGVRKESSEQSEMISQLLFGEIFEILEKSKLKERGEIGMRGSVFYGHPSAGILGKNRFIFDVSFL